MNRWVPWIIALAALLFLFMIRAILGPFVIAIILAYILVPGVDALAERFHVRRFIVVASLYLLFVLALGLLFWWFRPALMLEFNGLRRDAATIVERAIVQIAGAEDFSILGNYYTARDLAHSLVDEARAALDSPRTAIQFAQAALERLAEVFLTFIALFYLLLDWESLVNFAFRFVPAGQRPRTKVLVQSIHRILGQYLRGQLILIVLISSVTFLALRFVFHLPFSLPIAILTGFLEIIPLVGPVAAAGLAAISALSTGGTGLALWVILFYTVLRQIEDQLIAPNVLGRAVNVHPLAAIFAVLAGGVLAGPLGLLLGVPVAAAINVILSAVQAPVSRDLLIPSSRETAEKLPGGTAPEE